MLFYSSCVAVPWYDLVSSCSLCRVHFNLVEKASIASAAADAVDRLRVPIRDPEGVLRRRLCAESRAGQLRPIQRGHLQRGGPHRLFGQLSGRKQSSGDARQVSGRHFNKRRDPQLRLLSSYADVIEDLVAPLYPEIASCFDGIPVRRLPNI